MKQDILKPILDLTIQESLRDNLLSCSCQEYFEHMRKVRFHTWHDLPMIYNDERQQENIKEMIKFCMTKHKSEIQKLAKSPLGGQRFELFIRRYEMNIAPLPEEGTPDKYVISTSPHFQPHVDIPFVLDLPMIDFGWMPVEMPKRITLMRMMMMMMKSYPSASSNSGCVLRPYLGTIPASNVNDGLGSVVNRKDIDLRSRSHNLVALLLITMMTRIQVRQHCKHQAQTRLHHLKTK